MAPGRIELGRSGGVAGVGECQHVADRPDQRHADEDRRQRQRQAGGPADRGQHADGKGGDERQQRQHQRLRGDHRFDMVAKGPADIGPAIRLHQPLDTGHRRDGIARGDRRGRVRGAGARRRWRARNHRLAGGFARARRIGQLGDLRPRSDPRLVHRAIMQPCQFLVPQRGDAGEDVGPAEPVEQACGGAIVPGLTGFGECRGIAGGQARRGDLPTDYAGRFALARMGQLVRQHLLPIGRSGADGVAVQRDMPAQGKGAGADVARCTGCRWIVMDAHGGQVGAQPVLHARARRPVERLARAAGNLGDTRRCAGAAQRIGAGGMSGGVAGRQRGPAIGPLLGGIPCAAHARQRYRRWRRWRRCGCCAPGRRAKPGLIAQRGTVRGGRRGNLTMVDERRRLPPPYLVPALLLRAHRRSILKDPVDEIPFVRRLPLPFARLDRHPPVHRVAHDLHRAFRGGDDVQCRILLGDGGAQQITSEDQPLRQQNQRRDSVARAQAIARHQDIAVAAGIGVTLESVAAVIFERQRQRGQADPAPFAVPGVHRLDLAETSDAVPVLPLLEIPHVLCVDT
eukprot:Opistho-2@74974